MNAVVSASAGVAILYDGENLESLHTGASDNFVPRRAGDVPHLLGGAKDLEIFTNQTYKSVVKHLRRADECNDALQLALIVLDPSLTIHLRVEACEALNEMSESSWVDEYVRNVLYARPLPASVDIFNVITEVCATSKTRGACRLFFELDEHQTYIRMLYECWLSLPATLFNSQEFNKNRVGHLLMTQGITRAFVVALSKGDNLDDICASALTAPSIREIPDIELIVELWIGSQKSSIASAEHEGNLTYDEHASCGITPMQWLDLASGGENRRFTRLAFKTPITFHDGAGELGGAIIINIGYGGLSVTVGRYLKPQTCIHISADYEERKVSFPSIVAWCMPESNTGKFRAGLLADHNSNFAMEILSSWVIEAIREYNRVKSAAGSYITEDGLRTPR